MTDMENGNKTFKWGDISTNPADLPAQSLFALAQRGYTHVLGNEVASQVATWRKTEDGAKATEAEVTAWVTAKREAKLDQIMKGTLGVRVAGAAKVSGIEAIMRSVAVERLRVKRAKYKLKLPTGDKTINVAGKDMDRDALVAAELRHGQAEIKAEAERRQSADIEVGESVEELFA